jgi:hypothetical protein
MSQVDRPASEMIRLPADVVAALRRRAAAEDISIAEAARQLILAKKLGGSHGLLDHVAWLHDRLLRRSEELQSIFDSHGRDAGAVTAAVTVLRTLRDEWPTDDDIDHHDIQIYYQQ